MKPWTYQDAVDALAARRIGYNDVVVTTAVTINPTPDRRSKIWTKWPTIPAGARFRVEPAPPQRLGAPYEAKTVLVPCGVDRQAPGRVMLAQPLDVVSPLFAALLPHLTLAAPTLEEILVDVGPHDVLVRLLDQGRLTLADVAAAAAATASPPSKGTTL